MFESYVAKLVMLVNVAFVALGDVHSLQAEVLYDEVDGSIYMTPFGSGPVQRENYEVII